MLFTQLKIAWYTTDRRLKLVNSDLKNFSKNNNVFVVNN